MSGSCHFSECMSLSHTKEWEYMEEVLIVLETESTVDITMSRMITELFHRIGMNLLVTSLRRW